LKFTRTSPLSLAFTSALDSEVSSTAEPTVVTCCCTFSLTEPAAPQPQLAPAAVVLRFMLAWLSYSDARALRCAWSLAFRSNTTLALIAPSVTTMRLIPSRTIDDSSCWRLRAICRRAAITSRPSCSGSERSVIGCARPRSALICCSAASASSLLIASRGWPPSSCALSSSMPMWSGYLSASQSRALFMLMLSCANWSTVCATDFSSCP
jgi:hypothetical protein